MGKGLMEAWILFSLVGDRRKSKNVYFGSQEHCRKWEQKFGEVIKRKRWVYVWA